MRPGSSSGRGGKTAGGGRCPRAKSPPPRSAGRSIGDLLAKFDNSARTVQTASKRRRRSGSAPADPDAGRSLSPAGRPAPPAGSSGRSDGELRHLIGDIVRTEMERAMDNCMSKLTVQLREDFESLNKSVQDSVGDLGRRIQDMEGMLFEKGEEMDRLRKEVETTRRELAAVEEALDDTDADRRQPTLVLSGPAVPAPRGDDGREDAAEIAVSVIRGALPSVQVVKGDIAACFRVGKTRKLICRFLRHGPGSVRDLVYAGRFSLMRERESSKKLFVAESLTKRRQIFFNILLQAKRESRIHSVFTRNGVVYYKERQHEQNIRVDNITKLSKFTPAGQV